MRAQKSLDPESLLRYMYTAWYTPAANGIEGSGFAGTYLHTKIDLGRLFHVIFQVVDTLEPFLSLQCCVARL